jgi:CDP-2,3-bis-(O-geranylgeranyl)-sn-glycerol synthase
MIEEALKTFWLFLPAGLANMTPILIRGHFKSLGFPVSEKLFGSNKTWRGLFGGTFVAILVVYAQEVLYPITRSISYFDYEKINIVALGIVMGAGALIGDMLESFAKRRLNIAPGESLIILDQTDWIIGVLVFGTIFYKWKISIWVSAIIIFGALHFLTNLVGYALGIRKHKI